MGTLDTLDTLDITGAKTPSGTGTGVAVESREGGHREGGCGHLLTRHRHIVPGWVGAIYSIQYTLQTTDTDPAFSQCSIVGRMDDGGVYSL